MTPYMPQPVVNFEIVDHEVLKKQDYVVSTRMQNLQKDGYVVNASIVCHTFRSAWCSLLREHQHPFYSSQKVVFRKRGWKFDNLWWIIGQKSRKKSEWIVRNEVLNICWIDCRYLDRSIYILNPYCPASASRFFSS